MSDVSKRYKKVVAEFTTRVEAVPAAAWNNQSPCDDWAARDVVRRLAEWLPALLLGNWRLNDHQPPRSTTTRLARG